LDGFAQTQAMNWLVKQDSLYLCPNDTNLAQRYSLAVLWYNSGGESWLQCKNNTATGACDDNEPFLSSGHECQWMGVGCDLNLSVTALHLDERNVTGTLPSELESLVYLQEIDMDSNSISGTLPSWLGEFEFLEIIDMDTNNLSGSIPLTLYNAAALRVLDLDSNKLTGSISDDIENLTELYFLQLDFNMLTGSIPSVLGQLSELQYLSLFGNNFTQPIPADLCGGTMTIYANCDICTVDECCSACLNV
jgi:hypothetical protein